MKKKSNQEEYTILQKKLRELEGKLFDTKEKLKVYGYKDSSENADWTALSEKLETYQSRINSLKAKVAAMSQEDDKTITYKILETGEEKTVRLTDGEIDADQGKISRISPVGMALNNKKLGEIAEVETEAKKYQVQILWIEKNNQNKK